MDSPKVAVVDSSKVMEDVDSSKVMEEEDRSKVTEEVDSSKVEDISGVGAGGVMGWVARTEVAVEEGSNTVVLCITENDRK